MRIYMQVLGTRGDVEIFLILARELISRGHTVVVGSSPFYRTRIESAGAEWAPIGEGTWEELTGILRSLSSVPDQRQRVERYVKKWLRPQLAQGSASIKENLASSDYVVNNLKMVWKKAGEIVPGTTVTYDPPATPKRAGSYAPQRIDHGGALLDLVAMNRALVDPDLEWPASYRFTGFWFPPVNYSWQPDSALSEFMDAGDSPVVLTMGSMVMLDTASLIGKFEAALRKVERRGVVIGGWSDLGQQLIDGDNIFRASDIPYEWLLPRASSVIHHGGCGTVAAVIRAGKPSVLLPRIISQEHFAGLLGRRNLSAGTMNADTVSVDELANVIAIASSDKELAVSAANWASIVSRDGGVAEAADEIESHAGQFLGTS